MTLEAIKVTQSDRDLFKHLITETTNYVASDYMRNANERRGNIEAALAGTKANYTFPAAAYNLKIHESVVPADARNSTEQYGTISVTADKGNASISFETETESQADTKGQTKDKNK